VDEHQVAVWLWIQKTLAIKEWLAAGNLMSCRGQYGPARGAHVRLAASYLERPGTIGLKDLRKRFKKRKKLAFPSFSFPQIFSGYK
jgi:hypothetical protein